MAGGMPNIDPSVMQMLSGMQGAGSGGATPFLAGMGFTKFADTIKKLQGLTGGDKATGNIQRGITGQSVTPVPTAPKITPPNPAPAPNTNPLLPIGQVLGPIGQGAIKGGVAGYGMAQPAAAVAGPAATAGTTAASTLAGAGTGAENALMALLGLA